MAGQTALSPRALSTPGRHSNSSSDYLLLTTESSPLLGPPSSRGGSPSSPHDDNAPPTPRFLPLLQLVALLDLLTTLALALRVPIAALPKSALGINLARGVAVGATVSRRDRVGEVAPLMLGQLVLSALVLLYRLNELVQTTTLPPKAWITATTVWYLSSFLFAPVHYTLFLLVVGLPRAHARRRWVRGEQPWAGAVEHVRSGASVRSASFGAEEEEEEEGAFSGSGSRGAASDEGHSSSSDDDDDDIIDVPRPYAPQQQPGALRNRASRASLLSAFSPPPPGQGQGLGQGAGADDRPGFGASRRFGSIRSLAGI